MHLDFDSRIGTIIFRVAYGHYVRDEDDPFLVAGLAAIKNFSEASAPGRWLVDFIPQRAFSTCQLIISPVDS